ncbi:16S rRNA (adenine(1518)-N(6)/adenine(1519)-N(6))-dimethyltransferase RsmA [Dokdonella sp.]|uniref:16S rRNA (adenine(1518)-N(6)/adenine(1519)-N(6))- dimethyltransferase RsmA n=1 Tax=Dokdonella sp. TaxID=2291710 RepID=UPI003C613A3F
MADHEPVTRYSSPTSLDSAHVTRKRFGQHFLCDEQIISRIVQAINPLPGQRIVEIGPGEGAITLPMLRKAGKLTVIELDRDLVPRIAAKCAGVGEVEIINADVLNVDLSALAGSEKLRVVGNLPYNISSPILFHCIEHLDVISDMYFMLQKEVVERMAAAPGSKVYGRLSVMLQLACKVEALLPVPPESFRPPPKVDSAIVGLTPLPREDRPVAHMDCIARLVRAAFGQRRKTLSNSLDGLASADDMRSVEIDPRARAEQLAPQAFVALARHLAQKSTPTPS